MPPGVLMLWSGTVPRHDVLPLPAEGLLVGRELAHDTDDRISRQHVSLRCVDGWLIARDRGSRNGTFANGLELPTVDTRLTFPSVIRAGRTVCVAVRDVAPYAEPTAPEGPVMARACRTCDEAARADENLVIEGPPHVVTALARRYTGIVGGETVRFLARDGVSLAMVLANRAPRTVVLDLTHHALMLEDIPTLATWLETDVRFVTLVSSGEQPLSVVDEAVVTRLRRQATHVWPRYERLPSHVVDRVAQHVSDIPIHATAIEVLALALATLDEEAVLRGFEEALAIRGTRSDELRGSELRDLLFEPADPAICVFPEMHPRRRGQP